MQKTSKEFNLRIGFIIVAKIETFTMVRSIIETEKQYFLLIHVQY